MSALLAAVLACVLVAGCAQTGTGANAGAPDTSATAQALNSGEASGASEGVQAVSVTWDSDDYYFDWRAQEHQTIDLSGGSATIDTSGIYELTGTLKDGSVTVEIDKSVDKGTVFLVLNNATIGSTTTAPINIVEAKKAVLILEPGTTNTITQGAAITTDESDDPNAAVFSKADFTITGSGSLDVSTEFNNGITSKDDLKITDGTITVTAANNGVVGKDLLAVQKADMTITAGKDGIRSSNTTDAGAGNILIADGSFAVTAGDDGIQAESILAISGGTIAIENSTEALEGASIDISGGTIDLTATDDGVNVSSDTGTLTISGGEIKVDAEGDGLDSNNDLVMTGGTVYIDGPTTSGNGAFDHTGQFAISGGTLIAADGGQMVEAPSSSSTQPTVMLYYTNSQQAGTETSLKAQDGTVLASYSPHKAYRFIALSTPGLKLGETYTLYAADVKLCDVTVTTSVVSINETGTAVSSGGMGGGMGGAPGQGGPRGGTPSQGMPAAPGTTAAPNIRTGTTV
jgi:hypothetical protein